MTDNKVQTNKYDYKRESSIPKVLATMVAVNNTLSYDFIKLEFDLALFSREAHFVINRYKFKRSDFPEKLAKEDEVSIHVLFGDERAKKNNQNIHLTNNEKLQVRNHALGINRLTPYHLAKIIYPNCKLFFDCQPRVLGNIKIYIKSAKLYIQFSGKISADESSLGYINRNNIDEILDMLKNTGIISFDNETLIRHSRVLHCHIVLDVETSSPNTLIKAFSSYLPLRTDKYAVLPYASGYEVIQRRKKGEYEFAIYHKGKEINTRGTKLYKKTISDEQINNAQNIVRLELRLFKFIAQRLFLKDSKQVSVSEQDTDDETGSGNLTLQEALEAPTRPITHILNLIGINEKALKKARGKYLVSHNEPKPLKIAEYQRMLGCLALLEKNDYDFDKVRSHIEVELGIKLPSNYLDDMRERLQDYIACYKPRAIMTLQRLLDTLEY